MTKRFPGVVANDHVSFEAAAGEVHALLGENGAGKTTLCNLLMGLYRPDEGKLFIGGDAVQVPLPERRPGCRHLHGPPAPPSCGQHDGGGERRARMVQAATTALLARGQSRRRWPRRADRFQMPVDPKARIWQLSLGRAAAGRDPESALPRRQDPHSRRADHRAHAAGDRPALLERARHGRRRPDGDLHLPQAARGPVGGRPRDDPASGPLDHHRRDRRHRRRSSCRFDGGPRGFPGGDRQARTRNRARWFSSWRASPRVATSAPRR